MDLKLGNIFMRQFRYKQYQAKNPLTSIFVAVFGITVVLLSLALGFFVFIGAAVLLALFGAVMKVRQLWTASQSSRQKHTESPSQHGQPQIIEGEYREVDSQETDKRNH